MESDTAAAFNTFKSKLLLTDVQKQNVTKRKEIVDGHLTAGFGSSSNLPLIKSSLIGSAGRGTIIRPLVDIDILAVFSNKDGIYDAYRTNSQAFLYRVRDVLNKFSRVETVGARGQAVRFFYTDDPHVDVAPVFMRSGGGYLIPDGQGGWLATNPDEHASYLARRDTELGNRLKTMIRMSKRWNAQHSGYFKSFHLECLMAYVFKSIGNDSRVAFEKFFEWAQSRLVVEDPAGFSGDLSTYLSVTARMNLKSNLESARDRAARANAAERQGNHKEAIRLWRLTFGDEFPAYG